MLLIDETDEGFANVYSTAMSIQNLVPRASHRKLVIGICAVVLAIAWVVPLAQYESFLLFIGSVFVPLLGVLAADFFVVHGGHYDPAPLLDWSSAGCAMDRPAGLGARDRGVPADRGRLYRRA